MNKLKVTIASLLVACLGIGVMNAQDNTTAPAKPATTKKAKSTTSNAPAAKPAATTTGQHMKKDGTPDKRYKENKGTAAPAKSTDKKGTKKAAGTEKKDM